MKTSEESLQEQLELWETGATLETCLANLPQADAELLQLAVSLKQLSFPARNQVIAAAQRANLLRLAAQEQPLMKSQENSLMDTLRAFWRGGQRPAVGFSGAMLLLVLGAVLLGIWGIVASQSGDGEPGSELAMTDDATVTPIVEVVAATPTAELPETAVSPNPTLITQPPQTPQQARLTAITGIAEVQQTDGSWTAVSPGFDVAAGQRVRTGKLSTATLTFYDGSSAILKASSELSIDELDAQPTGPRTIVLSQWAGESEHDVTQVADTNGRYTVLTPNGSGTAQGTHFHVLVSPALQTIFRADEGSVAVTQLEVTVIIVAGQLTIINPGQTPSQPYFTITGEGQVTAIGPIWTIGGQSFETHNQTILVGMPQVGDWVFVSGHLREDGTRVADQIILLESPPAPSFTLVGVLENMSDTIWVVSGQRILLDADTQVEAGIELGDPVRVTGHIQSDGVLLAWRIQNLAENEQSFTLVGVVQAITAETWTISAMTVTITAETEIEPGIALGSIVQVEGHILSDGTWLADYIRLADDQEAGFTFVGQVENINPWQVAGIPLQVREWSRIDPTIQVGDMVWVAGRIHPDGTWVASDIERLETETISITFVGVVNSVEPWVVGGIPLLTDENTWIADGVEVGVLVRVQAVILPDGSWLAVWIRPFVPIFAGCFDISATVSNLSGNQLQLNHWNPITLDGSIGVVGEIQPQSVILLTVCIRGDVIVIIAIIVIHDPIIIIVPPPVTTPPPTNDNGSVTICHKNKNTLTLPQSAVSAHLGHGDTVGPCP